MKETFRILGVVLTFTVFTVSAYADVEELPMNGMSGITPTQMNQMYNDYFQNYMATEQATPGSAVEDVSGSLNDENEKKSYHYEGKTGQFYGVEMPKRSFNNIDYPY